MKTFLNVIGALALIGSFLVFIGSQSAIHEILSGVSLLIACSCMGFAAVCEKQDKTNEQLALVVKGLATVAQAAQAGSSGSTAVSAPPMVPVPGKELYFVSDGERGVGPYNAEKLKALLEKGTITRETYVLKQGTQEWQKVDAVFPA